MSLRLEEKHRDRTAKAAEVERGSDGDLEAVEADVSDESPKSASATDIIMAGVKSVKGAFSSLITRTTTTSKQRPIRAKGLAR